MSTPGLPIARMHGYDVSTVDTCTVAIARLSRSIAMYRGYVQHTDSHSNLMCRERTKLCVMRMDVHARRDTLRGVCHAS